MTKSNGYTVLGWKGLLTLNPFGTLAAIAAVVLGAAGTVVGEDISQGMTLTLHSTADLTAHAWGVLLMSGGILKLVGLYLRKSTLEIPGLWCMAGGYGFYSITVTFGLGVHGIAAGTISAAMTISCMLKAHIIVTRARWVVQLIDREDQDGNE
jgi:hypothetical protein